MDRLVPRSMSSSYTPNKNTQNLFLHSHSVSWSGLLEIMWACTWTSCFKRALRGFSVRRSQEEEGRTAPEERSAQPLDSWARSTENLLFWRRTLHTSNESSTELENSRSQPSCPCGPAQTSKWRRLVEEEQAQFKRWLWEQMKGKLLVK